MPQAERSSTLFIPALAPFYEQVIPLSWLIVRCAVGVILAVHGTAHITEIAAFLKTGVAPHSGAVRMFVLLVSEFIGGICIALGLLTRFFAPAAAIEIAIITFGVFWRNGFSWSRHGYEYTLMWGLVLFAVALRGGGPYSLDRLLGREL